MVNYNDGNWHNWDRISAPPGVHEKSLMDQVWFDQSANSAGLTKARPVGSAAWGQTIKFRVVKEYREPRDFWLVHVPGDVTEFTLHHCEAAALLEQHEEGGRILHVREVLE